MRLQIRATVFAAMFAALFGGCSMPQYVPFPDQALRVEDPGKARIYVVRPPVYAGSAIRMKIFDGDVLIGKTRSAGYLCWEREPGETTIIGKAENRSKLILDCEAGEVYFIGQVVLPGILFARNRLKLLDENEGRHRLKVCIPPHER